MNGRLRTTTIFILILSSSFVAYSQQVTLYDNHFESPNIPPMPNCGPDLDATNLDTIWSGTAGGTGGGGSFQQVNTVETILIHGPDNQYTDASGIGGNYCISMLSVFQDDRAALTLNSQNLPFAIISMDISAIDVAACGGPFGLDTPMMNIKIYDSPGGIFSFYTLGTLLDEKTMTGTAPGATIFTFNWSSQLVSMDISNSTDGNITVVFDLTRSGYAAIDNLLILSSITSVNSMSSPDHEIYLFPNPAHGEITVKGLQQSAACILITDVTGRLMKAVDYSNVAPLDISDLEAGSYFLNISTRDYLITKKMIVM